MANQKGCRSLLRYNAGKRFTRTKDPCDEGSRPSIKPTVRVLHILCKLSQVRRGQREQEGLHLCSRVLLPGSIVGNSWYVTRF